VSDPETWRPPAASPWAAPVGDGATPPAGATGTPGGVGPSPDGAAPTPGWTPPPRPGIIPLRPLTLGDILAGAFQVIRRNPRPTFGFALVVSLVSTLVVTLVTGVVTGLLLARIDSAAAADVETVTAGSVLGIVITTVVASTLSAALTSLVLGVISLEVARGALGERHTLRGLWQGMRGRIWPLVGWTVLLVAAVFLAIIIVVALITVVFAAAGTTAGVVVAVIVVIVGGLGATVLGFWLTTKLAFVAPALVVERRRLGDAIARSWRLTRGHFWRILGIQLLVSTIVGIAVQVVTVPLSVVGQFGALLINPNGSEGAGIAILVVIGLLTLALVSVATAVALVAQSAVPALLYLDVRMRSEGLDLELQRVVEDRAAGRPVPENPYLPPTG